MVSKPQGNPVIKDLGKAKTVPKTSCPSPKTFVDYIEGKITGEQKEEIHAHIEGCKDCMSALQAVFSLSAKEELRS